MRMDYSAHNTPPAAACESASDDSASTDEGNYFIGNYHYHLLYKTCIEQCEDLL